MIQFFDLLLVIVRFLNSNLCNKNLFKEEKEQEKYPSESKWKFFLWFIITREVTIKEPSISHKSSLKRDKKKLVARLCTSFGWNSTYYGVTFKRINGNGRFYTER
jgi:hypothetical protein